MSKQDEKIPKKDAVKNLREHFYNRKPKSTPKELIDLFRKKEPSAKKDPKVAIDQKLPDAEF